MTRWPWGSGCPLLDCSSEGSSFISSVLDDPFTLRATRQAANPRSRSYGCGRGYGTGTGKLGPGGFNSKEIVRTPRLVGSVDLSCRRR